MTAYYNENDPYAAEWLRNLISAGHIGYACGAVVVPAAGVKAPHGRHRLWFVADADAAGRGELGRGGLLDGERKALWHDADGCGADGRMGDADDTRSQGRRIGRDGADQRATGPAGVAGFWDDADWIACRDGKWRPVEPGTFPLAHWFPTRVGKLRAYGNAIVPQVAAEVINAYMECRP